MVVVLNWSINPNIGVRYVVVSALHPMFQYTWVGMMNLPCRNCPCPNEHCSPVTSLGDPRKRMVVWMYMYPLVTGMSGRSLPTRLTPDCRGLELPLRTSSVMDRVVIPCHLSCCIRRQVTRCIRLHHVSIRTPLYRCHHSLPRNQLQPSGTILLSVP